jgi:hypothetical protein
VSRRYFSAESMVRLEQPKELQPTPMRTHGECTYFLGLEPNSLLSANSRLRADRERMGHRGGWSWAYLPPLYALPSALNKQTTASEQERSRQAHKPERLESPMRTTVSCSSWTGILLKAPGSTQEHSQWWLSAGSDRVWSRREESVSGDGSSV